jgi:hypothetical protein
MPPLPKSETTTVNTVSENFTRATLLCNRTCLCRVPNLLDAFLVSTVSLETYKTITNTTTTGLQASTTQ